MEGDNNVIYGSFGTSGLSGDGVPPIASATSDQEPQPAGQVEPSTSPQDLEDHLQRIVLTLRHDAALLVSPGLEPETSSQMFDQLKALQETSNKVSLNLQEALKADDGYISAQQDLESLGADAEKFHQEVLKQAQAAGVQIQQSQQLQPAQIVQAQAGKPFPWLALGIGLAAAGGIAWMAAASPKGGRGRSGTGGPRKKKLKDAQPAP